MLLAIFLSVIQAQAQEYMFTTVAGSGGPGAVDGPGTKARFNSPEGIAVDATGAVYIADSFNSTIRKLAPDGSVTTVAGLATKRGVDDGTGGGGRFDLPAALVLDANRNIYVADQNNQVIRKISPDGFVSTLAGFPGRSGTNDGAGNIARFNFPGGLAIDSATNLYVADTFNHTIRKVTPAGVVTTIAGTAGASGNRDDIGLAAQFNNPRGIAAGSDGTIYVADTGNQTIRRITTNGEVMTLAGIAGQAGRADDTGTAATFNDPIGIAIDTSGNLYVADSLNSVIRRVAPDATVTTFAGDSTPPNLSARPFISYQDGAGTVARFKYPFGVALDNAGNVYVADRGNDAIRRITPDGVVSTLAGSSQTGWNDGPGTTARFRHPTGVTSDKAGNLFVVDGDNNTIRQITPAGIVSTIAGDAGATGNVDGVGSAARFTGPRKLTLNSLGELYVADTGNSTVRRMIPPQSPGGGWEVRTFAGQPGLSSFADGTGSEANFNSLYDVASDASNNLFVADKDSHLIRKATPQAEVTTLAGIVRIAGSDDGPGDQARFNLPYGVAVDRAGFVYVADTLNHTIRKITPEGIVSTLAGEAGVTGSEDGVGNLARFTAPYGLAVDGGGNVYVADYFNSLIRKITPDGVVTTIGGQFELDPEGFPLNGSADGLGSAAHFYNPKGIAVSESGTVYIADSFNNAIRVGTTNFCRDVPIIDQAVAPVGQPRQLSTEPQDATVWQWSLIRRPANSHATLSAENVRNPIFIPDVADVYVYELRATNALGATCVRTLSFTATKPPPMIVASSTTSANGEIRFTLQAAAGASIQVQVSSDLTRWFALGTFQLETDTFTIVDRAPVAGRGFYRLRLL